MQADSEQTHYSPALNLVAGGFFLLWAGVGWIAYLGNAALRASLFRGPDPGPALLPLITLSLLTAGGAIILLRGVICLLRPPEGPVKGLPDLRSHVKPMTFLSSLILTVALLPVVGFVPVGFGFTTFWLFVLASNDQPLWRRALVTMGLAAAITFGIWYGFVEVLRISLPR